MSPRRYTTLMTFSISVGLLASGCSPPDEIESEATTGAAGDGSGDAGAGGMGNEPGADSGAAHVGGAAGDGTPMADAGSGDTGVSDTALGDSGIYVREVLGFYSGDWGDMLLREVVGEIWGSYAYREGTLIGSIQGDAFVGWWTETPSRLPPGGAGEAEFRWLRTDTGSIALDGRWRFGTDGAWNENWDVALVNERQPGAELVERFDDASLFRRHP